MLEGFVAQLVRRQSELTEVQKWTRVRCWSFWSDDVVKAQPPDESKGPGPPVARAAPPPQLWSASLLETAVNTSKVSWSANAKQ